jgi:hypothetical protein
VAAATSGGRVLTLRVRCTIQEKRNTAGDRRNYSPVCLYRFPLVAEDEVCIAADRGRLPDRRLNNICVEEIDCAA